MENKKDFLKEVGKNKELSRRDFIRHMSYLGLSAVSAGVLFKLLPPSIASAAELDSKKATETERITPDIISKVKDECKDCSVSWKRSYRNYEKHEDTIKVNGEDKKIVFYSREDIADESVSPFYPFPGVAVYYTSGEPFDPPGRDVTNRGNAVALRELVERGERGKVIITTTGGLKKSDIPADVWDYIIKKVAPETVRMAMEQTNFNQTKNTSCFHSYFVTTSKDKLEKLKESNPEVERIEASTDQEPFVCLRSFGEYPTENGLGRMYNAMINGAKEGKFPNEEDRKSKGFFK